MISYVDKTCLLQLQDFLAEQKDIYSCRTACLIKSYGLNYDFLSFHIQCDKTGAVTAAVGKYYSDMTVSLTKKSDFDELSEFISFSGASSILCAKPLPMRSSTETGMIMELKHAVSGKPLPQSMNFCTSPDLRAVWELLKSCEGSGFAVPEYEDFLLDMSHKLRHDTAHCIAVMWGEKTVSAAMTVAESDNCAVIGAVASDKGLRRSGLGSACMTALCSELKDKKIFIMRELNANESFYKGLGFENTEKFYLHKKER